MNDVYHTREKRKLLAENVCVCVLPTKSDLIRDYFNGEKQYVVKEKYMCINTYVVLYLIIV